MLVVAAFVGGWGHAEPLLPVARLAMSLGHRVVFAGQQAVLSQLAALGFDTWAVGPDTLSSERRPLVPDDRERERSVLRDHFIARFGAHRASELGRRFAHECPGLVVSDEVDAGARIAAEVGCRRRGGW